MEAGAGMNGRPLLQIYLYDSLSVKNSTLPQLPSPPFFRLTFLRAHSSLAPSRFRGSPSSARPKVELFFRLRASIMNCKAVLVLVAMVAAAMIVASGGVSAQSIGSVQLINVDVTEGVGIKSCTGPDGRHVGPGWIAFPGYQYFQFEVNALSNGWWCDFEYKSAPSGVVHTAPVQVWQGILRSNRADATETGFFSAVPCVDCIWKIHRDGFYRADDKNHESFRFMAPWF